MAKMWSIWYDQEEATHKEIHALGRTSQTQECESLSAREATMFTSLISTLTQLNLNHEGGFISRVCLDAMNEWKKINKCMDLYVEYVMCLLE